MKTWSCSVSRPGSSRPGEQRNLGLLAHWDSFHCTTKTQHRQGKRRSSKKPTALPIYKGVSNCPQPARGSLCPAAHTSTQGALCARWHLSPPPRIPISPGVPEPVPSSEGLWQLLPPRAVSRRAPVHGLAELWAGTVALPAQAGTRGQAHAGRHAYPAVLLTTRVPWSGSRTTRRGQEGLEAFHATLAKFPNPVPRMVPQT